MRRLSLTRREQGIFGIVFFLLLGLISYKVGYGRFVDRKEWLQERIQKEERRLNKNLKILQQEKILQTKYGQVLKSFQQEGTEEQVMSALLSEIEAVAGGLPIHLSEMKPQKVKKTEFGNTFSVSLILDGALSPILNFVHTLQSAPHQFEVGELRLEKKFYDSSDLKCYLIINRFLVQP